VRFWALEFHIPPGEIASRDNGRTENGQERDIGESAALW
jgi:hypothetical protein